MAPMKSFRGLVARAAPWRLREWGRGKTACRLRGQHGRTLYRLQGRLLCKTRYPAPAKGGRRAHWCLPISASAPDGLPGIGPNIEAIPRVVARCREQQHEMGRQPRVGQRGRPPWQWGWGRHARVWWAQYRHRHHRDRACGRLGAGHQSAHNSGPAQWGRHACAGAAGTRAAPTGRRHHGPLRIDRAGGYGRCLANGFPRGWRALPGATPGAVSRRHAHRLRHRAGGNGAVLLPRRPEGVHRPGFLRNPQEPPGRARRLCPGLRDCP